MSRTLLVASWNINSINARIDRLGAFLSRVAPDIVCLQELKCVEEKFPRAALEALGYHSAVLGQPSYNGVGILSRQPFSDVQYGLGDDDEDSQARFIAATVAGVRIMSAYIPNGQAVGTDKFAYKLRWLQRLRAHLDRRYTPHDSLLLCGDFNVAPDDLDVAKPEAWRDQILFSEPEKSALAQVQDFGLTDTFRLHESEGGHYSWWDYRQLCFPRNDGLRIDFVFATSPLAERCRAAWIEREERKGVKPSDHAPCLARFDL